MTHSSSAQGYESRSSYISDDDLAALENDFILPPIEQIESPVKQASVRKEMTTEEQIELLREQQARESTQSVERVKKTQKAVRFTSETKTARRPSTLARKSSTYARRM